MTANPFAIGEEFPNKWSFVPYIERGIINYARVDLCNAGGFTEAMKVAGWCEVHYIDMMPHNPLGPMSTMANVHFGAALPNYDWLEDNRSSLNADKLDSETFRDRHGVLVPTTPLPTTPGLGIEFNEERADQPFRFYEQPHLHRKDGSKTNW